MRKVPKRKIMRSLCRTHRTKNGNTNWWQVSRELLKLKTYQQKMEALKKERENK